MSVLVPPRQPSGELLDDADLSTREMTLSLADLATVNRLWGSSRTLARHVAASVSRGQRRCTSILDVGAGGADLSGRLASRLRRRGIAATVFALDVQWRHLAAGRRRSGPRAVPAVAADAFALPFSTRSVDWAISTLLFHHFSPRQNVLFLRELDRVCRRGFAVLDLRRHRIPLIAVSAAGRLLFRTRVSLSDGVASVKQAYTPEEARGIAEEAVRGARVRRVFPYGILVTGAAGS